ncbi:MAG: lysine--tRNA ligase, partial [Clostridia bacterium]|nr:lysine--tRNA ligase [Clostridia bacterium]
MSEQNNNTGVQETELNEILQVRRDKLKELQDAGSDPFEITKFDRTHTASQIKDNYTEEERQITKRGSEETETIMAKISALDGQNVTVAGRIMSKRGMGKVGFLHVADMTGSIQLFVKKDILGEDEYNRFKKLDIGDIVGADGEVFTTQTGEVSVRVSKVTLLSKSLQPLPEKFHGMTNTDLRYRQRYVDLIMNNDVKDTFIKRSKIISSIRRYLDGQGFLEVETPMLVSNAGGAAARPFETHFNALDEDFKLRISLELYLKRLIVGGLERVYEIGRVFRNEGLDTRHNPEFTLM